MNILNEKKVLSKKNAISKSFRLPHIAGPPQKKNPIRDFIYNMGQILETDDVHN